MRAAVVGLGWAAGEFHLPALRAVDGVEIVGGADPSEERRALVDEDDRVAGVRVDRRAAALGAASAGGRRHSAVSHAALSIAALEGGAHVICEKPFVSTVEEADRVLATAMPRDFDVAVNHQYRAKPVFRAVKEQIGKPSVGRLVFCQVSQLMDLPPWDEPCRGEPPCRTARSSRRAAISSTCCSTSTASCRKRSTPGTRAASTRRRRRTRSIS